MSAYQSNAGFDRSQLHHINKDSRESAPSPMLPHGGHAQNEGTPTTSAVHAFGNEHSGASLNAKGAALGRCDSEPKLVRAQRLAAEYTETKIIKRQRRLSKCRYISSLRDISQEYKRRRFDNEKIGAPTDFFCYHRKAEKIRKCTSSYTQKYMRAVLPVIKKQDRV